MAKRILPKNEELEIFDPFEEEPEPEQASSSASAERILARTVLLDALAPVGGARALARPGTAFVVEVPSPAWGKAVARAAAEMVKHETLILCHDGSHRSHHSPTAMCDEVASRLSRGHNVVGVSPSPSRFLPRTLVASADVRVAVSRPDARAIRKAIRGFCGGPVPKVGAGLLDGLDLPEILASLRAGTSPAAVVARLRAVRAALDQGGDEVADAPPLEALHGYGEAMSWALRLREDLVSFRSGLIAWGDLDRACIFAGPPGTGKTTLARAVARELGLPFFATSMGEVLASGGGYLDKVCQFWEDFLSKAAQRSPAMVFVDEIDAIPNRATLSGKNAEYWRTLVGFMLATLDGAGSRDASKLVLVGATNTPQFLDPALVRPGRFGRVVEVPLPDAQALAAILRFHLGTELPGADLDLLARLAEGATGAEAGAIVARARAIARGAGRPMRFDDMLSLVAPAETRSQRSLRTIAVHEAGHAVAAVSLGMGTLRRVSIIRSGGFEGSPDSGPGNLEDPTRDDLETSIVMLLAGRAAEEVVLWRVSVGAGGSSVSDLARATVLCAQIRASYGLGGSLAYVADPAHADAALYRVPGLAMAVEEDLARLYKRAIDLVRAARAAVESVADRLVTERFLDGSDATELIRRHLDAGEGPGGEMRR